MAEVLKYDRATGNETAAYINGDDIAADLVTDDHIGQRTINDATAHASLTGSITNLFSLLGKLIKGITGKSSALTPPVVTIEQIDTDLLDHENRIGALESATPGNVTTSNGSVNSIPYWTSTTNIEETSMLWDSGNGALVLGGGAASAALQVTRADSLDAIRGVHTTGNALYGSATTGIAANVSVSGSGGRGISSLASHASATAGYFNNNAGGVAVEALTGAGFAVRGYATTGVAIQGQGDGAAGIGVKGTGTNATAIAGRFENNSGGDSIQTVTTTGKAVDASTTGAAGRAVKGSASNATGVAGEFIHSAGGSSIIATTTGAGTCISGLSGSGVALQGTATTGKAVLGQVDSAAGVGLQGTATHADAYAMQLTNATGYAEKINSGGRVLTPGSIKTSAYTIAKSDNFIQVSTNPGAAFTLTLPALSAVDLGWYCWIEDVGFTAATRNISIARAGTDTWKNGVTTNKAMNVNGDLVMIKVSQNQAGTKQWSFHRWTTA